MKGVFRGIFQNSAWQHVFDYCCIAMESDELEYDFACSIPDSLVCKVCLEAVKKPQLTGCCGNNVCKHCLDKWKESKEEDHTGLVPCPVCGTSSVKTFPNKLSDREIRKLHVYCYNKTKGCEWEGEINDIKGHNDNCSYGEVPCPHNCGMTVQRQFYDLHAEFECPNCEAYCQLCYIVGKKSFIEGEHMEHCPKLALPCPNDCGATKILREAMEEHRSKCPLEKLQCEFFSMGCELEVARKDMESHNVAMISKHLALTKMLLNKTNSKLKCVKMELTEAKIQLADKDKVLHETLTFAAQNQWPMKISSEASKSLYGAPTLPAIIRVTGLTRKQRQQHDWYSNGFITNTGGYKVRLKVDPTGSRGTHMAVYTEIMPGPKDDTLPWPVRGKFIVELLNQLNDDNHYKRIWLYDGTTVPSASCRVRHGDKPHCWGSPSYISLNKLRSTSATCQFIKDNCIYFRITYQRP